MLAFDRMEYIWSKCFLERSNWLFYVENRNVYLVDDEFRARGDPNSSTYELNQIRIGSNRWDNYVPPDITLIMKQRRGLYGDHIYGSDKSD